MKTNWIKPFIYSAGGILLAAALIRFLIAAGHHPALALPEPLLGIPLRYALLAVGTLELIVAGICLFGKNARLQAAWLAWLGTNFVVFQIGLVWMHVHPQTTCLGSLTDPLDLARGFTGEIMTFLPFYVLLGSFAALMAPWLAKQKVGQASSLSKAASAACPSPATPAYARFLKISCTACGGHIEFPTNLFGGQIPCPHCQSVITLQKAASIKMACPACGGHLEFPDHAQGQQIPCPHCQTQITLKKGEK
jgi:DNA-directed RNA polymerase subunit RPC12/RpoP